MKPIPVIETHGSPYEVGRQIGLAAQSSLCQMYDETLVEAGANWARLHHLATPFIQATEQRLPKVVEELRGCADGAGIPFRDLFLMSIEELLYEEVRGLEMYEPSPEPPVKNKGCSDLAAAPPATIDGHVWLAHNNDLGRSTTEQLFVTHFCADGEPEITAVTVGGLYISIGMNSAGISLTGNQLTANDSRVGVPRLLIVRDILAQTTVEAALASAIMPERASSYNNIIASADGRIVNAEGSGTAAALTWSAENDGTVVHTNHYLAPEMLQFEADRPTVPMSASRCSRAFDYARKYRGRIGLDVCKRFLRDHVYAPWSVCKHAGQSVTVFSTIIDLTEQKLWLTRGNPCRSEFELY